MAISHFNTEKKQDPQFHFMMDLGDLIDGKSAPLGKSQEALTTLTRCFAASDMPHYHCIGNHELYNFTKKQWSSIWETGMPHRYYSFPVPTCEEWVMVVLDPYGISILGSEEGSDERKMAASILDKHNPNADQNSSNDMEGPQKRFVQYGGGLDPEQLTWLKKTLSELKQHGKKALLFTHLPLHPDGSPPNCLLWNYEEVLTILRDSVVKVVFSGHAHCNQHVERDGIHFVVCQAILECSPGSSAYASVNVHSDSIHIAGHGHMTSYDWTV